MTRAGTHRAAPGAVGVAPPNAQIPTTDAAARGALLRLQRAHRACTRCVTAGYIPEAHPVFSGHSGQRIMLVGQAPGPVERDVTRPFAGRAGRILVRWMLRAGFRDEADFRERVYIIATTTCFPGRRPDGGGDRRPSGAEVALCSPWRLSATDLLRPRLIIPVGSLALSCYVRARTLDELVGSILRGDGSRLDSLAQASAPLLLPLPHPSGQSRWLNDPQRVALLDRALRHLAGLVSWAESS